MKDLYIIAGPTATGKSAAAVRLAKKINGEVISADSMQVYRGMDIGTAKITEEETEGVPHHLSEAVQEGNHRDKGKRPCPDNLRRHGLLYTVGAL